MASLRPSNIRREVIGTLAVAVMLCAPGAVAVADTAVVRAGPITGQITGIENGQLVIRVEQSGTISRRPLADVLTLTVDDEPAFNAAEQALADGKPDVAVDGYLKTLKATNKDWLRERAAARLLEAAGKAGRFDAAVTAYVALVARDPAAEQPTIPPGKTTYLDTAAKEIATAAADAKRPSDQRLALLGFLVDLHRARNDDKAAGEAAEALLKLGGTGGAAGTPAAARAVADLRLTAARRAIDAKDFAAARGEIESNKALFVDPAQQVEALYLLAAARDGQARASGDAAALADAAIAYVRVAAHFKDLPGAPRVADSLVRAAALHEQMKDPAAARELYRQVAAQYPDAPAAQEAKRAAERLSAAAAK